MAAYDYMDYLDSLLKGQKDEPTSTPADPSAFVAQTGERSTPVSPSDYDQMAQETAAPAAPDPTAPARSSRDDVRDFLKYKGLLGKDDAALNKIREDQSARGRGVNFAQAIGDLGAGLANVKPDNSIYTAERDQSDKVVKGAEGDVERNRKLLQDYITNKRAEDVARDNRDARIQSSKDNADLRKQMFDLNYGLHRDALRDRENKSTDAQAQAAGFGKRLEQAEGDFRALTAEGYNRADKTAAIGAALPGFAQTSDAKRQDQAERNFVNALLRRESGAAIAPSEFQSAEMQYFPRSGDTKEVLEQKERNRQQALESLKAAAGPAWAKIPLVSAPAAPTATATSPDNKNKIEAEMRKRGILK